MFSLQRFLSKGDKFFNLLEASADEACESGRALMEFISTPTTGSTLEKFVVRRRQDKRITEEITALLCSTFVTPLEREDIETLSHALYRIPKTLEKFAERLLLSQDQFPLDLFRQQGELLSNATETVCQMVRQLRHGAHIEKTQEQNAQLQRYEGEADKLMIDLLRDLYSGKFQPLQVIVLRDLFELLEKVIDRCRDAGNVIFQIALKNS
jgi:uncharacterized protein